jgi:hypothetical protein
VNKTNFPINFSTQKDVEIKLAEIQRSITQLWNRNNSSDKTYNDQSLKISGILNDINQITTLIKTVKCHTTTMPDSLGINPDHDKRYITRAEVDYRDTKRLVAADSPYTASLNDEVIFCGTDAGAITINLPAGRNGLGYRIINCGSSANNVTITPDGSELIDGVGASKTLTDGLSVSLCYEPTEGWW